jgi:hypothetical protein
VWSDADLMTAARTPVAPTLDGYWYGAGWVLAGPDVIYHFGDVNGFRSMLVLAPEQRYAVAAVFNDAGAGRAAAHFTRAELTAATGLRSPFRRLARIPVAARAAARLAAARLKRLP